jgi:hypothetical protein
LAALRGNRLRIVGRTCEEIAALLTESQRKLGDTTGDGWRILSRGMGHLRMAEDGCGCIELWHEHTDAPHGSIPSRGDSGKLTHWVRLVDMVDRVACPFGDCEVMGDPALLIGRSGEEAEVS